MSEYRPAVGLKNSILQKYSDEYYRPAAAWEILKTCNHWREWIAYEFMYFCTTRVDLLLFLIRIDLSGARLFIWQIEVRFEGAAVPKVGGNTLKRAFLASDMMSDLFSVISLSQVFPALVVSNTLLLRQFWRIQSCDNTFSFEPWINIVLLWMLMMIGEIQFE